MLALPSILAGPLNALTLTVAHFVAVFRQENEVGRVYGLIRGLGRALLFAAGGLIAVLLVGGQWVADFFQLETVTPVVVTFAALLPSLYGPLVVGVLTGAQAFIWCSGLQVVLGVSRLALAVILVACGLSATGALWGNTGALFVSVGVGMIALRQVLGPRAGAKGAKPVAGMGAYFLKYTVATAGVLVLMNADTALVKHYFESAAAGAFAKVGMVARLVVILPMPRLGALFPKVASAGDSHRGHRVTLIKAVVMTLALVVATAGLCTLVPGFVLRVLAHSTDAAMIPVLRAMVWALAPLAVVLVLLNFELAQRRFLMAIPLLVCALAYLGGVAVWHAHVMQVVAVLAVCSVAALVSAVACLPWKRL
jgi:hypothetical protein